MLLCRNILRPLRNMKAYLVRGGVFLACATLVVLAIASAGMPDATTFGVGAFALVVGMSLLPGANGRLLFLGFCGIVVVRYLTWRGMSLTLDYGIPSAVMSVAVYCAELYTGVILLLGFFVNAEPLERKPAALPADPALWPTVDVYVPTYSEPLSVVAPTVLGALEMRYPASRLRVCVLDDGAPRAVRLKGTPEGDELAQRTAELKALCERHGAVYLTREKNEHAKSGNLNAAMLNTDGELILVLDADHVPSEDFLENTVGFFLTDPKLALVQTPHFFVNADPVEKNLGLFQKMPAENDLFYRVIQKGLDMYNCSFFCGSAAILRRTAIEEIGGFSCQSITEDAATTVSLHQRGWNSVYFGKPMIAGLQPETFSGFLIQRLRWATGMTQIFLKQNPLFARGLSTGQRLGYLSTQLFWLFPFARVMFFLAPVLSAVFRLQIYPSGVGSFLGFTLPHLAASFISSERNFGKMRRVLMSEVYETLQAFYALPALVSTILRPSAPTFKVTPKGEKLTEAFISEFRLPFYCFLGLTLLGLGWTGYRLVAEPDARIPLAVVMGWLSYNALLLLGAFGTLLEQPQRRSRPRVELDMPLRLETAKGEVDATVLDANELGVLLRPGPELANESFSVLWKGQAIPTRVVKRFGQGDSIKVAALYAPQTPMQERAAVALAFGNSDVWQRMWESREASANVLRSVSGFIAVACTAAMAHFRKAGYLYVRTSLALEMPAAGSGGRLARRMKLVMRGLCFVVLLGASSASNAQSIERSLSALGNRDVAVTDVAHPALLQFDLSPREKVGGAHLDLHFGSPVLQDHLQMLTDVNQAGWTLQPVHEEAGALRVQVPTEALRAGRNEIRLALFQATSAAPAQATGREIQSTLDAAHSGLTVDFAGLRANPNPGLAQLNVAFDSRGWLPRKVVIVTGEERLDSAALSTLSTVVQGVAQRLGTVPLEVRLLGHPKLSSKDGRALSDAMSKGADIIFFGTRDRLRPYLPSRALESIEGPNINLVALNHGAGVGLVVTGRTSAELAQAASWLTDRTFPFAWSPAGDVSSKPAGTSLDNSMIEAFGTARFIHVPETDHILQAAALELEGVVSQRTGRTLDTPFVYSPRAGESGFTLGTPHQLGLYSRLALGLNLLPAFGQSARATTASYIESSLTGTRLSALTAGRAEDIAHRVHEMHRSPDAEFSGGASAPVVRSPGTRPVATAVLWLMSTWHMAYVLAGALVLYLCIVRIALAFQRKTRHANAGGCLANGVSVRA